MLATIRINRGRDHISYNHRSLTVHSLLLYQTTRNVSQEEEADGESVEALQNTSPSVAMALTNIQLQPMTRNGSWMSR